ncbi:MAG: hypothetical protein DCC75_02260 [Proteobacteria bacterium]|nr:MAG: hypothetical protein DCC75_02260 [Pseudomonadota bacterium]
MISFAIIVFREALEIALVLSILLAGTRGVAGRAAWIWIGVVAGLIGSVGVAISTERISEMLEGFGQEVFNATILITAALLIGTTVVWMKRHAKEITMHLREVGLQVSCGKKPLTVLAVVVALTILRDGTEIVLLAQGILVSAQNYMQLVAGGLIGLIAGTAVGAAIYLGIIRSATRHIFEITSWMLIALCAGMVSQGVALLAAADILPSLVQPLWDTSAVLSDHSIIGKTLHVMFGYAARPSGMQALCYVLTVLLLGASMHRFGRVAVRVPSQTAKASVAILLVMALIIVANPASAIDKIYSPIVEEGELELETRGTYSFDDDDSKDGAYKQLFGLGYGFTDRFAAEIYGEIENSPGEDLAFEAVMGEGRYQLFEQGEYWLDAGLYLEYEYGTESKEHEMEGKILLEKTTNTWINTANFILERQVFGSGGEDWEGDIRWHTLYRFSEELEPGIEIQSGFGALDDAGAFDDQDHNIGPALHGKLLGHVGYELAGLFGVSDAAADFTLRWVLEWEL